MGIRITPEQEQALIARLAELYGQLRGDPQQQRLAAELAASAPRYVPAGAADEEGIGPTEPSLPQRFIGTMLEQIRSLQETTQKEALAAAAAQRQEQAEQDPERALRTGRQEMAAAAAESAVREAIETGEPETLEALGRGESVWETPIMIRRRAGTLPTTEEPEGRGFYGTVGKLQAEHAKRADPGRLSQDIQELLGQVQSEKGPAGAALQREIARRVEDLFEKESAQPGLSRETLDQLGDAWFKFKTLAYGPGQEGATLEQLQRRGGRPDKYRPLSKFELYASEGAMGGAR